MFEPFRRPATFVLVVLATLILVESVAAQQLIQVPAIPSLAAATEGDQPQTPGEKDDAATEKQDEAKDGEKKKDEKKDANPWAKVPPVRVFPRLGFFTIPPTGPGYYSALDFLHGQVREKPPKYGYPPVAPTPFPMFDADFRYLDDPKNTDHDWFDPLHRVHLGCDWLFATGGQLWWRHMHEVNSRLSGRDNDYELYRTRIYGDLWYQDRFRLFVEGIDAHSFGEDLPPLRVDENRTDLLNAFVDVKVADLANYPAYARFGRQELMLGSQRLISPLDWANTRRTFEGLRLFRQGEKFDIDAFWVRPVIVEPTSFDTPDDDQNFVGVWTTYRPEKGHFLDLYYLMLDDDSPQRLPGEARAIPFDVHTLGFRYAGDRCNWLWDVETMLQLGRRGNQDICAGAVAAGGGYHFKDWPLNPVFWVYYDYASGDRDPRDGHFGTFNQLFAFGHYYLGWIDLVGRQNIHDVNCHLYLYPTKWIQVWLQYHHFELDSARDALYSAGGVPLRRDVTGRSGTDVGDELDIVINFHLGRHSDILIGYSQLFAGSFLRNTAAAPGSGRDAQFFFAQYSLRW